MRLHTIFSRMIAIALGGATDLSPIMRPGEKRGDGSPNWATIYRLYATLGTIQAVFSFLLTAVAFTIGLFSLQHLLQGYPIPARSGRPFTCSRISSFLIYNFSKFGVALEGLNKVALTNRLNMIFDLLSLVSGVLVLTMGGNILSLSLVMQAFRAAGRAARMAASADGRRGRHERCARIWDRSPDPCLGLAARLEGIHLPVCLLRSRSNERHYPGEQCQRRAWWPPIFLLYEFTA